MKGDSKNATRYANFMACVRMVLPDATSASLDLLTMTRSRFHPDCVKLVDATKQFMVHLLGRQLLLNSQPGGFRHSYAANDDDFRAIRALSRHGHVEPTPDRHRATWAYESVTPPSGAIPIYSAVLYSQQQNIDAPFPRADPGDLYDLALT
ncbi:hypothetical protein BC940DRAFT_315796 [Gongronella butleri]|nr:hypothetical protein BC940DRAFT_315796 [Gongronella butleri]